MADVSIRQGDRLPVLTHQFITDDSPVSLTGGTVTFNLWNAATGTQVITDGSCTVTNATAGRVEYAWSSTDATLPAAVYLGSFTATFPTARTLTSPTDGMIVVELLAETGATWSYTGDPTSRPVDAVRFLSGDTDSANRQVSDTEIAFLLDEWNDNTYLAAAAVCDAAAGKAAAQADESKSVGDLSISTQHAAQARSWEARGASLRAQDARRHPPSPTFSSRSVGSFAFRVGMDTYQTDSQYGITPE